MTEHGRQSGAVPDHLSEEERFSNPLQRGVEKILTPFQSFIQESTTTSILLLCATVMALLVANSAWHTEYKELLHTQLGVLVGDRTYGTSLYHWVNDGLMALFFFVIGLEIKRELLAGELQNIRLAVPVVAAALGGMIMPALIYAGFNGGTTAIYGWGIPLATDTAFAVGVLALLGRRIPASLAAFLTALAIIDDIGAVLVIALFYSDHLSSFFLLLMLLSLALLVLFNLMGIRHALPYLFGGLLVWWAAYESGLHATVAGILVALTVPARPRRGPFWFLGRTRRLVDRFEELEQSKVQHGRGKDSILATEDQHAIVERVQQVAHETATPLQLWERTMEWPVSLLVLPVFALVNAAVPVTVDALPTLLADPITLGIVLGLLIGKVTGITGMCWLTLKCGFGELPAKMHMHHVIGIGLLGGMGFTMSIFIAGLSFEQVPEHLLTAKSAILLASLLAGIAGYLWLRITASQDHVPCTGSG